MSGFEDLPRVQGLVSNVVNGKTLEEQLRSGQWAGPLRHLKDKEEPQQGELHRVADRVQA